MSPVFSYKVISQDIKDGGYYNIMCDNGERTTVWVHSDSSGYYYTNRNGYSNNSVYKVAKNACNE